jgi:hypothetical protein
VQSHINASTTNLATPKPVLFEEFGKKLNEDQQNAGDIALLRDPIYESTYKSVQKAIDEGMVGGGWWGRVFCGGKVLWGRVFCGGVGRGEPPHAAWHCPQCPCLPALPAAHCRLPVLEVGHPDLPQAGPPRPLWRAAR